MKIDIERLMSNISEYSNYGKDKIYGITRPSFSQSDYKLRRRFTKDLKDMEMEVIIDEIANIWGFYIQNNIDRPPILMGSHLDTVPNGGAYDGALGVLVAKEVIQTIHDYKVNLIHPLSIVSFTAEEPNDFKLSTMGSRVFSRKLSQNLLLSTKDSIGRTLEESVKLAGGDLRKYPQFNKEFSTFIELHIEQGKRLEEADVPVGVVEDVVGIYRDKITLYGEANHAGTTMMNDRIDALSAASEIVNTVERIMKKNNTEAVATIGEFNTYPNAANIIPGKIEFILELRSASQKERSFLLNNIYLEIKKIGKERKVMFKIENILNQPERKFDKDIIQSLEHTIKDLQIPYINLSSMAGHDAAHMIEKTKTAMLFVRSINGISHSPYEYTTKKDIEIASNILLQTILNLDKQLLQ